MVKAFEDAFEGSVFRAAEVPEADGVGMAINGIAAAKAVMGGDGGGAAPVEEVAFNGRALGMAADGAQTGMSAKLGATLARAVPFDELQDFGVSQFPRPRFSFAA